MKERRDGLANHGDLRQRALIGREAPHEKPPEHLELREWVGRAWRAREAALWYEGAEKKDGTATELR